MDSGQFICRLSRVFNPCVEFLEDWVAFSRVWEPVVTYKTLIILCERFDVLSGYLWVREKEGL